MPNISISLTDTQIKSLEYCCYSVQEWCDNVISERARKAKDEIIAKLVAHCNANSISIAIGEDAQITQAYDLKIVDTAKNVSDNNEKAEV
tara:strand:+ start:683 stop:952 length:270 start_codon:yes stop_codon:yes gene_type:complete